MSPVVICLERNYNIRILYSIEIFLDGIDAQIVCYLQFLVDTRLAGVLQEAADVLQEAAEYESQRR